MRETTRKTTLGVTAKSPPPIPSNPLAPEGATRQKAPSVPRTHAIHTDPIAAARIHKALAEAPEERPKLPKPKPLELLQTWKIKAAARQTRAHRKFVIEARWHPVSRPRSSQPYDAAAIEGTED
jgi:hypothetical protein